MWKINLKGRINQLAMVEADEVPHFVHLKNKESRIIFDSPKSDEMDPYYAWTLPLYRKLE